MNRSQLYGVEKGSSSNGKPISKFRQDYISKRNGRGGQYSQGPDEQRNDPYQQKEVFTRHHNKLSKLKNTSSNSESQLRDQNRAANIRRDLSSQLNQKNQYQTQQQAQLNQAQSQGGLPSKSPLINSRKIFEPPIPKSQNM